MKLKAFVEEASSEFRLADVAGNVVIVEVLAMKEVPTRLGDDPVECASLTVHVVDGPHAGEVHTDVLAFNRAIVEQVRDKVGEDLVVVVESYKSRYGTPGLRFSAPTKKQFQMAEAFTKSGPAAGSSGDEDDGMPF